MCWNIAEGSNTNTTKPNALIPAIAREIGSKSPDIVLLNEVKHWDILAGGWIGDRIRQTSRIAEMVGLPYLTWGNAVNTGLTGHKVNSVLSRYPLTASHNHPISHRNRKTSYAILETSFMLENIIYHLFSTRFNAHNEDENISAHQQAIALVKGLPVQDAVIFGGDFNANRKDDPQWTQFADQTALRNAFYERPDSSFCGEDPEKLIDHVFLRGHFIVARTELRCPWAGVEAELSEHPWLYVELSASPDSVLVPNVKRASRDQAVQVIAAVGLQAIFNGSGDPGEWVLNQSPEPGGRVIVGSSVTLELRNGPIGVAVPDVLELTADRAAAAIRAAGLQPQFTGSGTWVRTQMPQAGTLVTTGSIVTLQLRTGRIP
jgi:endonuclease/exonuclease/phosphatase family metal-dependent hydrolase